MLLSLQSTGSNVTMPYAGIGASLQHGLFLCVGQGGCFCCFHFLSLVVLKILWAGDNWFSFNYHTTAISYTLKL